MGNLCSACTKNKEYALDSVPIYPANIKLPHDSIYRNMINQASNRVTTTKYSLYNFIPLNFYEQVTTRWANVYFILIAVLNYLPWAEVLSPILLTLPVVFIIAATMVKDGYEDYRRYKSDNIINQIETSKLDFEKAPLKFQETTWGDLKPGDVIRVYCGEFLPADCLILSSSEEGNICYLQTSNLDGESNLKQFQSLPEGSVANSNEISEIVTNINFLDVNTPTPEIYNIVGKINLKNSDNSLEFDSSNCLLRGCTLRNTDFVEAMVLFTGPYTKTMLNSRKNKRKTSKLERAVNRNLPINFVVMVTLALGISIGCYFFHREFISNDTIERESKLFFDEKNRRTPTEIALINFLTFFIALQTVVPIAIYVSWEFVKFFQIYFIEQDINLWDRNKKKGVRCQAMNITEDLGQIDYVFSDKTGTLTENVMLFRSCTIDGTAYHEKENRHDKQKSSLMPRYRKNLSKASQEILLSRGESLGRAVKIDVDQSHSRTKSRKQMSIVAKKSMAGRSSVAFGNQSNLKPEDMEYLRDKKLNKKLRKGEQNDSLHNYFTCIAVCHSALLAKDLEENEEIRYESESADELALLEFCKMYGITMISRSKNSISIEYQIPRKFNRTFKILHFRKFTSKIKRMGIIVKNEETDEIIYFVKGADEVVLEMTEKNQDDENLNIQERTSQHIDKFASKGLRTLCMAYKPLSESEYNDWYTNIFQKNISTFDDQIIDSSFDVLESTNMQLLGGTGIEDQLQTKVPSTIDFIRSSGIKMWVITGDKLETAINIGYSSKLISKTETELLVITKIQDCQELRNQMDRFLDQFLVARGKNYLQINNNNLAFSADSGGSQSSIELNQNNKIVPQNRTITVETTLGDDLPTTPNFINVTENGQNMSSSDNISSDQDLFSKKIKTDKQKYSLAIDGQSLEKMLNDQQTIEKFIDFISTPFFATAIICRATPKLKSDMVLLIKNKLNVSCLSIGDGANDVAMIQSANIGVGIFGNEGLQAAMNSDFAVTRFFHLKRMLFVHGASCYEKSANMVFYFIKKHYSIGLFVVPLMFYAACYTIVAYDDLLYSTANILWNSLHPIINATFDQFYMASTLERDPKLYKYGAKNFGFDRTKYIGNCLYGIYMALCSFYVSFFVISDSPYEIIMFSHIAFTITLISHWLIGFLSIKYWTRYHAMAIALTIGLYAVFQYLLLVIDTTNFSVFSSYGSAFLFQKVETWLSIILGVAITILPLFFFYTVRNYWNVDRRMFLKARIDQNQQLAGGKDRAGFWSCFRGGMF